MKNIEYYMSLPYAIEIRPIVEDDGEKYFQLTIPDLPGFKLYGDTQAEVLDELDDAKKEWFAASIDENHFIAEPKEVNDYSGRVTVRMPKTLHKKLDKSAKEEGISLNAIINFLLNENYHNDQANFLSSKIDHLADIIAGKQFLKNVYNVSYNIKSNDQPRLESVAKTAPEAIGMQMSMMTKAI